jgi:hypothetical protein
MGLGEVGPTKPDPIASFNVKENNVFATANAIEVEIDENIRLLAELQARCEREDEIARNLKVCTITT